MCWEIYVVKMNFQEACEKVLFENKECKRDESVGIRNNEGILEFFDIKSNKKIKEQEVNECDIECSDWEIR